VDIFKTINALRKDTKIYDPTTKFFPKNSKQSSNQQDDSDSDDDSDRGTKRSGRKKSKPKAGGIPVRTRRSREYADSNLLI
jgi:hypothetical protein